MHSRAWCAMANVTWPEILQSNYLRAGASVITTNTFSNNRNMREPAGLGDRFAELNASAIRVARRARDETTTANTALVTGSRSHQMPVLGRDDLRNPETLPSVALATERFERMACALAAGGVDFILMEMRSDPDFANPAITAAKRTRLPVWWGSRYAPTPTTNRSRIPCLATMQPI